MNGLDIFTVLATIVFIITGTNFNLYVIIMFAVVGIYMFT